MPAFRVTDLAKRWQCAANTVRAMIRRGELVPLPFTGRLIRISEDEVLRWEQFGSSGREDQDQVQKPPSNEAADFAIRSARRVAKQHR